MQLSLKSYRKKVKRQYALVLPFKFTYAVYLYHCLLILLWISIAVYFPFISTWKTLFSIRRRADLLVTKISQFLFVRSALISPTFLKDSFSEYRIFGKLFFSFSTLNMSFYYLLAPIIYAQNLTVNLKDPCIQWLIFLLLLSRFSLSLCLVSEFILLEACWAS